MSIESTPSSYRQPMSIPEVYHKAIQAHVKATINPNIPGSYKSMLPMIHEKMENILETWRLQIALHMKEKNLNAKLNTMEFLHHQSNSQAMYQSLLDGEAVWCPLAEPILLSQGALEIVLDIFKNVCNLNITDIQKNCRYPGRDYLHGDAFPEGREYTFNVWWNLDNPIYCAVNNTVPPDYSKLVPKKIETTSPIETPELETAEDKTA